MNVVESHNLNIQSIYHIFLNELRAYASKILKDQEAINTVNAVVDDCVKYAHSHKRADKFIDATFMLVNKDIPEITEFLIKWFKINPIY